MWAKHLCTFIRRGWSPWGATLLIYFKRIALSGRIKKWNKLLMRAREESAGRSRKKKTVPGEWGAGRNLKVTQLPVKGGEQKRMYLAAHLGDLQGVQKPRVCRSHDFAFAFFIFFFVFNLERKKKVYCEWERNFAISGALVLTSARGTILKLPVFYTQEIKVLRCWC